jgi:hypothetical protein
MVMDEKVDFSQEFAIVDMTSMPVGSFVINCSMGLVQND